MTPVRMYLSQSALVMVEPSPRSRAVAMPPDSPGSASCNCRWPQPRNTASQPAKEPTQPEASRVTPSVVFCTTTTAPDALVAEMGLVVELAGICRARVACASGRRLPPRRRRESRPGAPRRSNAPDRRPPSNPPGPAIRRRAKRSGLGRFGEGSEADHRRAARKLRAPPPGCRAPGPAAVRPVRSCRCRRPGNFRGRRDDKPCRGPLPHRPSRLAANPVGDRSASRPRRLDKRPG